MSNEILPVAKFSIFKGMQIRKAIHDDEWYFSVIDVIDVLTESSNPRRYWSDLKRKLIDDEGFSQLYGKIVQLKINCLIFKRTYMRLEPILFPQCQ